LLHASQEEERCAHRKFEKEREREREREQYNCRAQTLTGRDGLMLHEYAAAHSQMERGKHTQTVL